MKRNLITLFLAGLSMAGFGQGIKMNNRVSMDGPFKVDSMSLVRNVGERFVPVGSEEISKSGEVIFWIRLKATSSKSIDLLRSSDFRPIQLKWLRNSNYGYVPEVNHYEKITMLNKRDFQYYEQQIRSQGYVLLEFVSTNFLKRGGLYLIRPVFNDNQPVIKNGREAEFKFEIK